MRILFMGTPDFAVSSLDRLVAEGYEVVCVVTQPDRPKGRSQELTPPPVKTAALKHGLPVFQPEKIRAEDALSYLESLNPDLLVTAAYGQILPKRLLDMPRLGCVNVHASLLPKYRGGAPIHQSIINGDEATGVTLMRMVQALDAGDMLSQVVVPIEETDTVGSLHDKLSNVGSDLLIDTLPYIIDGSIVEIPQDHDEATYAPNLKREDERINWARPARSIFNQVRGLNPWPVAFTTFQGQVTKIWSVVVHAESGQKAVPGSVIEISNECMIVQAGEGTLEIKELQPSGKRRMTIDAFLRGARVELGDQFGVE